MISGENVLVDNLWFTATDAADAGRRMRPPFRGEI
jgi:hypothetical protein